MVHWSLHAPLCKFPTFAAFRHYLICPLSLSAMCGTKPFAPPTVLIFLSGVDFPDRKIATVEKEKNKKGLSTFDLWQQCRICCVISFHWSHIISWLWGEDKAPCNLNLGWEGPFHYAVAWKLQRALIDLKVSPQVNLKKRGRWMRSSQ